MTSKSKMAAGRHLENFTFQISNRWGSLRRSPRPLVGWGGGHPLRIPFPSTPTSTPSGPQHKFLATPMTKFQEKARNLLVHIAELSTAVVKLI